jgi:cytochrome c-type biogenesis protein CcmF
MTVGPPFFNAVNIPLGLFLLFLTGVGPLIAWRRTSPANLRKQFAWPLLVGASAGAILFALGIQKFYALMAYAIGAFTATTIVQEFQKGTSARMRMYSEGLLAAFSRLIARNRRRYGGYVVHAGIVVLFAAFAGMAFHRDAFVDLRSGETHTMTDPYGATWTFTNQGVSTFEEKNRVVTQIALEATRDGKLLGVIVSSKRQHFSCGVRNPSQAIVVSPKSCPAVGGGQALAEKSFNPSTEVGIIPTLRQDVYVVLSGISPADQLASLHINFNPLVAWVWMGGTLMLIGGMIVMWPGASSGTGRRRQGGYETTLQPEHQTTAAGA